MTGSKAVAGEGPNPGLLPPTDLTLNIASEAELRRRAAEGDQFALAELGRRQAQEIIEKQRAA